ncbi:MAG: hypothetical protein K2P80_14535 [Beijerinckiaceae bacterium]|nr:hypothetical protein [Beijerinckiaceae bacterium]
MNEIHIPWCGDRHREGISGRRIAIAGYSHWDADDENSTQRTIRKVMNGCWKIAFFDRIRDYFGFTDHAAFWQRVTFFNFVPTSIGPLENRYGWATPEQVTLGRTRVLEILEMQRPDELFVFTRKGWNVFPPTIEDELGRAEENQPHGWQTYRLRDGTPVRATGLRHPQFARKQDMIAAVSAILKLSPLTKAA